MVDEGLFLGAYDPDDFIQGWKGRRDLDYREPDPTHFRIEGAQTPGVAGIHQSLFLEDLEHEGVYHPSRGCEGTGLLSDDHPVDGEQPVDLPAGLCFVKMLDGIVPADMVMAVYAQFMTAIEDPPDEVMFPRAIWGPGRTRPYMRVFTP